jgi:transcriptional regulator GlxA family with amidase domain
MLLAAAGLTKGRPATTHQVALQELRESGADVREGVRYVDDGNLLTSAGVTAGLDLAFWIVERELGAELAMSIEREMAYVRTRQDSD